ncbi:unnamed protein product [Musa acuminata subsp. malaccensis]|uniref:(wild Malaysian banana) hypothetical protein n=1 Tax=Musa acuminata subsp. malaccensis TaxID=214687 RepID=A0A804K083_MUSAM|nr:unnamed protein product [Musa acuminata subsp. malaccensis]
MWENRFHKSESEDETSYRRIPFELWNVGKFATRADAAIAGIMPPPLLELQLLLLLGGQVSSTMV